MASIIGQTVGQVQKQIQDLQSGAGDLLQGPLNKGWRALILLNRSTSPMPKVANGLGIGLNSIGSKSKDPDNLHYAIEGSNSLARTNPEVSNTALWFANRDFFKEDPSSRYQMGNDYTVANADGNMVKIAQVNNSIVIANYDVSPYISVVLQNRPDSMKVEPVANWAVVHSMGRNNPFYFYTGGEDTITLEVSWYAIDEKNRDDVLNKCRLLESWSRANGYLQSPPVLKIHWGNSDIFKNDLFILHSANYELTNFQNAALNFDYRHNAQGIRTRQPQDSDVVDLGLLPNCAKQTLMFKRVGTSNRTWEDIIPSSVIARTPGVITSSAESDTLENSVTP